MSIFPGDLVEMNVYFAIHEDIGLGKERVGLVIAVKEANVDSRFRYNHVYYVWTPDGVVGPLFKVELTKL